MYGIVRLVRLIKNFYLKLSEDRIDAYSAQSAFFILMGLIPFFMLLLTMLQYTPMTETDMIALLDGFFPKEFHKYLLRVIESLYTKSSVLLSGTILAAIWACSKAMYAFTKGLNTVYGVYKRKNYVFARMRAALYILFLLFALVLAVGLFVFGNQVHDYLLSHLPLLHSISWLIISARTIGTILVLSLVFCTMYTLLPYEKNQFRSQIPGAFVAAFSWSVFSYLFSIYVQYFPGMSAIYGSLAAVVLVMLWLYACMWLLFLGAEINRYLADPEIFSYFS